MKSFSEILKNKTKDLSSFKKIDVALLCDQSSQFLSKAIHGAGIDYSLNINVWEAPINQIENQIYIPNSDFNNKQFKTCIIFESSHLLLKKYNLSEFKSRFAELQFEKFKFINHVVDNSQMNIILFNFYEINDYVFGNFHKKLKSHYFSIKKIKYFDQR